MAPWYQVPVIGGRTVSSQKTHEYLKQRQPSPVSPSPATPARPTKPARPRKGDGEPNAVKTRSTYNTSQLPSAPISSLSLGQMGGPRLWSRWNCVVSPFANLDYGGGGVSRGEIGKFKIGHREAKPATEGKVLAYRARSWKSSVERNIRSAKAREAWSARQVWKANFELVTGSR